MVLCRTASAMTSLEGWLYGVVSNSSSDRPEGFQTVFNDDFRLVFPYFRGPDACGDGFSARQPGKFAHQFGPEGAGPVAPAALDGSRTHMPHGNQGAFVHAFRFKTAHQVIKVFLAPFFRVRAAEAHEATLRMNPFGAPGGGVQPRREAGPLAAGEEGMAARQPERAGFRWM